MKSIERGDSTRKDNSMYVVNVSVVKLSQNQSFVFRVFV